MTVVVAVDFSRHSRKAFDWALGYAVPARESIVLVHAFDGPHRALGVKDGHLDPLGRVEAELNMDDAIELTEKWAQSARDVDLEVVTIAEQGKASKLILQAATQHNANMIVVGTRGRGAVKRAVLGSTAESVIQGATCPVVVIPA